MIVWKFSNKVFKYTNNNALSTSAFTDWLYDLQRYPENELIYNYVKSSRNHRERQQYPSKYFSKQ